MNDLDDRQAPELEFGLDTFGDVPEDDTGTKLSYAGAIRQGVEGAVLADRLGVDVIALASITAPSSRSPPR